MQQAETVLNVIRERGERGLPLENIYRLLYNRNLYLRAYGRIASNQGATTKGVTAETVDGMSLAKIDRIIEALRYERFRWTPVRRVNIPKPNGKTRALGIPTGPDKLLQEVIRMILEAYYEPQFSDRSHGFRPNRGCHTALSNVTTHWTGVRWFVEGDIKGCFDNIDHDVLLSVLGEKLHDNRFLRLLRYLLKAGYVEDWKYGRTLSGTPQGGIVSPILANIYLDRLDKFVENVLIPAHTRGSDRKDNREYTRLLNQAARQRKRGNHAEALQLRKQMQRLPSRDPYDPGYRRLRYVRYADDFVLGFIGPKVEAQQVKESLETFLRDTLKLELSREKTLITHATSQAARFLGYELVNQQANDQFDRNGRRRVNGQIGLRVPANVIEQHCQAYCAKANRHTAVTYSTMKITESWHSTSRSTGASSTITFWPTTSLTWGDCEGSWRCHWHGPLRQSTSPAHGRCDASTRASWTPSTDRASASRLSSNGTTASHLAWRISVAYP